MTINPYLNFPGTAEEAFNFYKSVFGGEFSIVQRFKDAPNAEQISDEDKEKILHISLPLAAGYTLMASDAPASFGFTVVVGNNTHLSLNPESREETKRIFDGLSAGGKITMDLQDTFWGAYFGAFTDKYGICWMINYDATQH